MILADRLLQVFHWPVSHPIRLLLPAMILASLVLHIAGIYLLRAPVPTRVTSLPPLPGKVSVLPAGDSVLLAARDPSWLQPGRFRDRMLPVPPVQRPLRALQPELPPLVAAPTEVTSEPWVPALPPLTVAARLEPRAAAAAAPELARVTARFDVAGAEVTEDFLDRLRAAVPERPPGLPTELLVVLDASGEARHVWLLRSCGDPALDTAAVRAVQLSRFGPTATGHRGILRVVWGTGDDTP
jgi:hypothetical protein